MNLTNCGTTDKGVIAIGARNIDQVERGLQQLHAELTGYGSFEAAPAAFLDQIATTWDEWSKVQAQAVDDGRSF